VRRTEGQIQKSWRELPTDQSQRPLQAFQPLMPAQLGVGHGISCLEAG
jgi:hypothetical protein